MDCRRFDEILNEQAYDALGAAERDEIAAHVKACPRCAEASAGQQLMRADEPAEPRAGFASAVRARALGVMDTAAPRRTLRWWLPAGGLAAAAVVLLAVAIHVLPGTQEPVAGSAPEVTPVPVAADTPSRAAPPALPPVVREFIAGVHYRQLAAPVETSTDPDIIEVCEFFAFTCPHCFGLEPYLAEWESRQPPDVRLVRVPVLWNEATRLHAQAFYTAEALGRTDIVGAMFAEIHERGNYLATVAGIRAFFLERGITAEDFDSAFVSRRVEASLRRAAELSRLYDIDATPTLAVDGRYVAAPADSWESLLDVVDALIGLARTGEPHPAGSLDATATLPELIDAVRESRR